MLFPIGIIIARYLRTFPSADSAWFYLHVSCQCSAYVIGVAGWATGLKLGSESKGITYHVHRNIGITFSVLQHCRKAVHGIFSRIGLFKVILRRRHLLYCHACFLKFEVRDNGLDGLGQIIGINLLYTGSLRSFKRRATRQRQLESPRRVAHCTRVVWCLWGQEASLGRPATREEVWKKIHMKIRDGKEVWVETRAGYTYDRYDQAIEELKKNRSIDDQGNPIMLSEEETLSCWLDVVGGVYKGRTYYLCSEKNFHRL